jgi:hypothetical protein
MAQPQLPILKGKNYEIWSKKMQSILEHEDIWYVVEADSIADEKKKEADSIADEKNKKEAEEKKKKADKKKKKDDKTAHCFILNGLDDGLDDSVLGKISETKSPKEAWKILKDKYTNESRINVAGLKITNDQFRAMAIGAVLGMIVAISGPLLGASMNPARTTGSSISIYMILGAVLGAIYYDVITPRPVPPTPGT